eukprot:TRINITY_DN19559_c0_g1_i2.p2 TRINITY_DN19559_c0_g1~~TRINITY_DN19559_c0_g1_i2.p2  ORF type:complete len:310 (+),score=-13.33 TRINITY_DN19559_c0_g1_i2:935-1864(+)
MADHVSQRVESSCVCFCRRSYFDCALGGCSLLGRTFRRSGIPQWRQGSAGFWNAHKHWTICFLLLWPRCFSQYMRFYEKERQLHLGTSNLLYNRNDSVRRNGSSRLHDVRRATEITSNPKSPEGIAGVGCGDLHSDHHTLGQVRTHTQPPRQRHGPLIPLVRDTDRIPPHLANLYAHRTAVEHRRRGAHSALFRLRNGIHRLISQLQRFTNSAEPVLSASVHRQSHNSREMCAVFRGCAWRCDVHRGHVLVPAQHFSFFLRLEGRYFVAVCVSLVRVDVGCTFLDRQIAKDLVRDGRRMRSYRLSTTFD